jgi:hypothetical protein
MYSRFLLCTALLCVTSTVGFGQQVSVNYNRGLNFSQYHTYAWGSNNTNQIRNSILAQNAQVDINMAMQSKGLRMVQESENPDLLLTSSGGMRESTSYSAMGMRGFGGGFGSITPQQNVEGTLIVELFDAKTQTIVWRGIAQDTLNSNGDKNTKMVANAVTKMFKQYPTPKS